jgi:NAD-dependent dihydropyrimidine dehydrogenase PreA subunit
MPLAISYEKCLSCTTCSVVCPMGIEPYKDRATGTVVNNDCIKCSSCVTNCPTNALSFNEGAE